MTDVLWTGEEIAAATGGTLRGKFSATGASINTLNIERGDVFFAVPGKTFNDGHAYVADAIAKGASGVVIERGDETPAIIVSDGMKALEDLGRAAVARSDATRIAITGSVGKTSSRAMAEEVFAVFGKTHASRDSLNNKWGVPLSLARMPRDAQYGIFEIGMNHANEITPLSRMTSPHVSIITNVAPAHIEHFGSLEGIVRAKAEIFHGMDSDGIVILPRDNETFGVLLAEAQTQGVGKIITFGHHAESDFRLLSFDYGKIEATARGAKFSFTLGMPGEHQAMNALAVLAAADALGLDLNKALPVLADLSPVTGRGNILVIRDSITVIDETHNASPIAVEAALKLLAETKVPGRRIAILGDMLELGDESPLYHAALKKPIIDAKIDHVLTAGNMMHHLADALPDAQSTHYTDSAALAADIARHLKPQDTLLVKGSRGSKMKLVIDALRGLGQN
jgi:UDP-N-acetylmuramoyl-tripeptide--D-alanyl-D-alanine ligase